MLATLFKRLGFLKLEVPELGHNPTVWAASRETINIATLGGKENRCKLEAHVASCAIAIKSFVFDPEVYSSLRAFMKLW